MNKPNRLLHLVCPALLLICSHNLNAEQLIFTIDGVASNQGKIYIQVFNGKDAYRSENAIAATIIPAIEGEVRANFADLKPGEYAVRYFHDEDGDGKLATNLLGMPTEGYGFSNAAKPNFGPVKYEAMKFVITEPITSNHSTVIY